MNDINKLFGNIFTAVVKDAQYDMSVYREILDLSVINLLYCYIENKSLINAIYHLSTMQRLIIILYFLLDLNLNEISLIIHSPIESVYSQKSKAIKRLRLRLTAAYNLQTKGR